MFYLKKLNWVLVLSLFVTGTIFAQPGNRQVGQENQPPQPTVPDSAQTVKLVDELASELSLSDDMKKEVLNLHLSHFTKVHTLVNDSGGDQKSLRSKMDSLRKEFQDEMKTLLSDKQYKKFENYMKKHDPRPERPQRGR